MKTRRILGTGVLVLAAGWFGGDALADRPPASDVACTGCVNASDLADGEVACVDLADLAVCGGKIAPGAVGSLEIRDGSVSGADVGFNFAGSASKGGPAAGLSCSACVSQTELDFAVPSSPARRVVVAASGGDYASIGDALAAINPDATNPYLIEVMPGTYTERITMKSYVQLRGAGRDVTIIRAPDATAPVISINALSNVAISGLTISGGSVGIDNVASSPTITENSIISNQTGISNLGDPGPNFPDFIPAPRPTITGNMIDGNSTGILNTYASPRIIGNSITRNSQHGIHNTCRVVVVVVEFCLASLPTLTSNTVTNNEIGMLNERSSPTTIGNVISDNVTGIVNLNVRAGFFTGNTIERNTCLTCSSAEGGDGVINRLSSPVFSGNRIADNKWHGILNEEGTGASMIGNVISGNGGSGVQNLGAGGVIGANEIGGNSRGILVSGDPSPVIRGNRITGNQICGICEQGSSARIIGNDITSTSEGAGISTSGVALITHNRITGNQGRFDPVDISIIMGATPKISLNVYDRLLGSGGVGLYNVNSEGGPAPEP